MGVIYGWNWKFPNGRVNPDALPKGYTNSSKKKRRNRKSKKQKKSRKPRKPPNWVYFPGIGWVNLPSSKISKPNSTKPVIAKGNPKITSSTTPTPTPSSTGNQNTQQSNSPSASKEFGSDRASRASFSSAGSKITTQNDPITPTFGPTEQDELCPKKPQVICDPECFRNQIIYIDTITCPGQILHTSPCNPPFAYSPPGFTEAQLENMLVCYQDCCIDDCNKAKKECLENGYYWSVCRQTCVIEDSYIPTIDTCEYGTVWLEGHWSGFDAVTDEAIEDNICGCYCANDYSIPGSFVGFLKDDSGDSNSAVSSYRSKALTALRLLNADCEKIGYDEYNLNSVVDTGGIKSSNCGECGCSDHRDLNTGRVINKIFMTREELEPYGLVFDTEELGRCVIPNYGACCGSINRSSNMDLERSQDCYDEVAIDNCSGKFFLYVSCPELQFGPKNHDCCGEDSIPPEITQAANEDNSKTPIAFECEGYLIKDKPECIWCLANKDISEPAPIFDPETCECKQDCKDESVFNNLPKCLRSDRNKDTCECCPDDEIWIECDSSISEDVEPNGTGFCAPECSQPRPDLVPLVRHLAGKAVFNPEICNCECETTENCYDKFGLGFVPSVPLFDSYNSGPCACRCDGELMDDYCSLKGLKRNSVEISDAEYCGCDCSSDPELVERLNKCPDDVRNDRLCECFCSQVLDALGNPKYPLKPGHTYNEYCESVCQEAKDQNIRPPENPPCPDLGEGESLQKGFFRDSAKYYIIGEIGSIGNCECSYCPPGKKPYICNTNEVEEIQIGGTENVPIFFNFPKVYVTCVEEPCDPPREVTECGHPIYGNNRVCACEPFNGYNRIYNSGTNECECIGVGEESDCYNEPKFVWNNQICKCECLQELIIDGQTRSAGVYCQELNSSSHDHWKFSPRIIGSAGSYDTDCECACDLKNEDCPEGYLANNNTCECEYEQWYCNDLLVGNTRPDCDNPDMPRCSKLTSPPSEEFAGRTLYDSEDECLDLCCKGACCYRDVFVNPFNGTLSYSDNRCEDNVPSDAACANIPEQNGPYEYYYGVTCADITCDVDMPNSSSSSSESSESSSSSESSEDTIDSSSSSSSDSSEDIICEGPCLSELGETICPNEDCDCINDVCAPYAPLYACCTGNGQCTPVATQSDCDNIGGIFLDGQSCASCPMGVCGCSYSLDRIRLLVVDNSDPDNPVMVDRTAESVNSFNWSPSSGHNWATGTCTRPGCDGGNTHINCSIYNKDGSISYCGSDCKEYSPELCAGCECDFTVSNPFLDDPIPGSGGTLPGNRQIYDSEINEFRNSVNASAFVSVSWKPGYPAAFNGASYAVWRDYFIPFASYFVQSNCSTECDCSGNCDENLTCISPCVCQDGVCVDGRLYSSTSSTSSEDFSNDIYTTNITFSEYTGPVRYDCVRGDFGTTTVNVPPQFTLPVLVSISGYCDDSLVIDGQLAEGGTQLFTEVGNCPYWTGPWEFQLNSSSFTVAAADLVGVNAGCDLTITITQI